MFWLALIPGIVAILFFLVVRVKRGGLPGTLAKSIPSFFFIVTACAALAANPDQYRYGLLIIPGLVCGLLGDIWLDLKYAYPGDADIYLYAGFYSFFVGHIFFITAIFSHYDWNVLTLVISFVLALAGAVINIALERPLKLNMGAFKITCFIYGLSLMMTASSSIVAAYVTGETVWYVMSAGSIFFLLSDLVLSGTYFGEGKNTPAYVVVNHGLYYIAQFLIASSILFMK
ncbi:MAG: hypothetical protein CVV44_21280 [Spirochaetae bacterium HGW-Spirochaetae-1]|jgi:uncharacterized membrane protein YhhN|nr:MAG: hypothetical protein CVV44_21280 [Spirochaetae bacterium HGW-Spirochaetae-1]